MLLIDVGLVFAAEIFKGGQDRIGRCLSQAAHGCLLNGSGQLLQKLQVLRLPLSLGDTLQYFQHSSGAVAAGKAFTAGFIADKVHEIPRCIHHTGILIHDNESAGTHDCPQAGQGFIIHRRVQMCLGQTSAGGTAGLNGLEFFI